MSKARDIADGIVTTQEIEGGAITTDKLSTEAVTPDKILSGAGSGLDADKLDGLDASQFMRSDKNAENSNNIVMKNADPYIRHKRNDRYIVISGGSGWSQTGAATIHRGIDASNNPGGFEVFTVNGLAVKVDKDRVVRIPNQPRFDSHFGRIALNDRAAFTATMNVGGFVLTNGNKTVNVPATGCYRIRWQALGGVVNNGHNHIFLFRNGVSTWVGSAHVRLWSSAAGECLLALNEGDYIELKCTHGGVVWVDGAFNKFQMQLIA